MAARADEADEAVLGAKKAGKGHLEQPLERGTKE